MNNLNQPIYDLYVTNVQKVVDIKTTKSEFEKSINFFFIKRGLDQIFGFVALIKIPVNSKDHTGQTYQLFLRLEKPDRHYEAVDYFKNFEFKGRLVNFKLNDIPSKESQWLSANTEYRNLNLHSEKVRYIQNLIEKTNREDENKTIGALKNTLNEKDNQIVKLESKLNLAEAKIEQLNLRLKKQADQSVAKIRANYNMIKERDEYIKSLEYQTRLPKPKIEVYPSRVCNNIDKLNIMLEAKDNEISSLRHQLNREIEYKARMEKSKSRHSESVANKYSI